jgi:hypothetical protein
MSCSTGICGNALARPSLVMSTSVTGIERAHADSLTSP